MIATIAILSALVKVVVDRVRRRWPAIDGDLVTLVAASVGVVIAFGTGLEGATELVSNADIPGWVDRLVTGVGIGLGAGFLSDTLAAVKSTPTGWRR